MRRLSLLLLSILGVSCWQPPDLPPPLPKPTDTEFLASRPYRLQSPADLFDGGLPEAPSDAGWPLVVILHGYAETGPEIQGYLGFDVDELRARAFITTPVGTLNGNVRAWHPDATPEWPYDSAYLHAVLLDVLAKAPIDRSRVFVLGFSQGAHMAHRLACDSADLVSAEIAIAGQLTDCQPSQPVSVLAVHGTVDPTISYQSGLNALALWAARDRCTMPLTPTGQTLTLIGDSDGGETEVLAYGGCAPGVAVELWRMNGVGHGAFPVAPDLGSQFMGWFDAHPR
jgi:polyhydroxybutyrate depolymerase